MRYSIWISSWGFKRRREGGRHDWGGGGGERCIYQTIWSRKQAWEGAASDEQPVFLRHQACDEPGHDLNPAQWPNALVIDHPIGAANRRDARHRHQVGRAARDESMQYSDARAGADRLDLTHRQEIAKRAAQSGLNSAA